MTQLSFFEQEKPTGMAWIGNRKDALERLALFIPKAGKAYAGGRNFDFGPQSRGNVSCLSPWIRHRLLLEEEVLRATLARHSLVGAEKFIQEVFWRNYFKGWMEHRPSVWSAYCSDVVSEFDALATSPDTRARFENALNGGTGIECFDAWVVELKETGYLHNHARMWFASIWIFTLRLPWQLGADFFMRHLLDGDPASNTLSWRWVGGLHTKGKTYLARPDNIEKYTTGRFRPSGLADIADPLVESFEHPEILLPSAKNLDDLPNFALVITQEDCHAETLPLPSKPLAILSLSAKACRSPLPTSEAVLAFSNAAVEDGLTRAHTHFGSLTHGGVNPDWAEEMIDFARQNEVTVLVTAWAAVGPVRDELRVAIPKLKAAGINLIQVQRPYDQACWPHASRGFFKLKKKIPTLIHDLGLG